MIIRKLTLFTTKIQSQTQFYSEVLGLPITHAEEHYIRFQIGNTQLEFTYKKNATSYHFAINIPCNKELEALRWLKHRVTILKDKGSDLIDFPDWNAKAMYFYDAEKNIVEFIARKNLSNDSDEAFDQGQLLEISEIGLPCDNIEAIYNQLNEKAELDIYSGGFDRFCAIGDERGLFICIDKNKKKWFPVDDTAFPSEFEVGIEVNKRLCFCNYENGVLRISAINR